MATIHQPLLHSPKASYIKPLCLVLSLAAIVTIGLLALTPTNHPTPLKICQGAHHTESCLAMISEVALNTIKTNDDLLQIFLAKSLSEIKTAHKLTNDIKVRINDPKEQAALADCSYLMQMSTKRIMDSMIALENQEAQSFANAHTWLSSVLTNHITCLDGLEESNKGLMITTLNQLVSRARTTLAIFVANAPEKTDFIHTLKDELPFWVTSRDRMLLAAPKAAQANANVVVAQDGSGNYRTLKEAVAAAPGKSNTRYVIYIKKGIYKENVEIHSSKTNLMLTGDGAHLTIITGSLNSIDGTPTFRSATVAADGDGFIAQDICFQNTAGAAKHQAVAIRVGADRAVLNRCSMDAFQDTLYTHSNRQFYRDCYITGTVDFIFGNAAVVFQNSKIVARKPGPKQSNMVTAQGREDPNQNTGTSIQYCEVIASADLQAVKAQIKTYLGRPWKPYAKTVVMQSYIGDHIEPAGWAPWNEDYSRTLYYGEYQNRGPGAGTSQRVKWVGYRVITDWREAYKFTVSQLIQGGVWLKSTGVTYTEGL